MYVCIYLHIYTHIHRYRILLCCPSWTHIYYVVIELEDSSGSASKLQASPGYATEMCVCLSVCLSHKFMCMQLQISFLSHCPLFYEIGSLTGLELTKDSGWPESPRDPLLSPFLALGL